MKNDLLKEKGNREYKSDLFSMLLQEKKYALEVYNALNGSDYSDPEEIEIITTEHGVSLSIRNDASFVIDRRINYYEHMSTYSTNVPLRLLIYFVNDLERYFSINHKDLFRRKRIMIPTPHFVVFYNGVEPREEVEEMRLSASFCHETDEPELELMCRYYNINPNYNTELKKKSKALYGYTVFVEKVRSYRELYDNLAEAIRRAIDECIEEDVLREFFLTRRNEVEKVTQLDFTFETREKYIRRDAREEGYEEGREDGREEGRKEGREEGRKEERMNTERERKRAEAEKTRADEAEEEVKRLRKLLEQKG